MSPLHEIDKSRWLFVKLSLKLSVFAASFCYGRIFFGLYSKIAHISTSFRKRLVANDEIYEFS